VRTAGRMPANAGGRSYAPIQEHKEQLFRAARREGRRDPAEAYAVDALGSLVTEDRAVASKPGLCEIKGGISPVPLETAHWLAAESIPETARPEDGPTLCARRQRDRHSTKPLHRSSAP
jgi:hypothetical protein